ncbi:MAG: efflux RND transporter permease subunit [Labilithrix sp.]|nr:efflux RND transporter permease subunit [Labilithrix sp.]MCW5812841.1 efflux RND transporter permease subunit [Labilithrix sp.]
MIGRVVDFSLRRRGLVFAFVVVLVLAGVRGFTRLPIEAYPDVADTWVQIITQWPGHAAEEIERQITVPIERVMNGVPKKTVVRSTSIGGLSVVTLVFADGTDSYFARQQVSERLDEIELPPGAQRGLGPLASPVGEILRYRLVNCATHRIAACRDEDVAQPPKPLTELKDLEEYVVERELLATDGVADVVSFGGTTKQYQVFVDPILLAAHALTFEDVAKALADANGNAGGGVIALGRAALNVRGVGLLSPEQIGDVMLKNDDVPVRVRQVARVTVGHRPRLGRVSVDGERDVVAAIVLLRKGEQADATLAALHARIDDVNARVLPRGVKIGAYYDRTELMKSTTRTVLQNLVEGMLLITLVLFAFVGNARAAVVAAITIPLALLFAFVCMDAAGIPANLLSIGALDFGMIVDGAIVMVENTFRHVARTQERGERHDLRDVARAASREVARPVVFAMTTIILAYLPIFTLERVEGKLFRPMAWTVAFAILGALVVSITVVPVLTTYLFKARLREWENPLLRWTWAAYRPLLARVLRAPRVVVAVAIALLVTDAVLLARTGSEFLPHLDEGAVWMRATLPSNVSLAEAEALVDGVHTPARDTVGVREILERYPEIRTTAIQLGRPDDGTDPTGFYNAEFLLVLEGRSRWRKELHGKKDELIAAITKDVSVIPGVAFGFSQPIADNVEEALTGVKGQLAVKITGDDLNALDDVADRIARSIQPVAGVVDLTVVRELGQSNVNVEIARDRAERFGLTVAEVEDVIEDGVGGQVVSHVVEGERRHELVVRYAAEHRDDVDALKELLIPRAGGRLVPLAHVADVNVVGGASRIFREDGRRYIAVRFGVRGRDLGSTVEEAQARVAKEVRVPAGYDVEWGGELESARRAGERLALILPVTLVAIFGLLLLAFHRLRDAAVVLSNVLLTSPVGGLAALLATGTSFSVSAGVGFLALFGVAVQTGVVLVARVNESRAEGRSIDDALTEAVRTRLRPIVMMALVATLGLLPAAVSTGIGSDSQKPLAIVVVGGLFSSLALSLAILPPLYKLLARKDGIE